MLKVSAPEMVSGVSGESEQKLRELFDQAVVSTRDAFILMLTSINSRSPVSSSIGSFTTLVMEAHSGLVGGS